MNGRDFLQLVWPATGYYCIAAPHKNPTTGQEGYKHSIHDTWLDAYLDARGRYHQVDMYFGIFTHINQRVFSQKWGRDLPSRKRENMAYAKCLFLDLDVGKGTADKPKYKDQAEALMVLRRFLFRTGLPDPIVVSSGNGLHVYWPFVDPIDAQSWKPHAQALRLLLDHHHVLYDPSRTIDTTSVLRVPGTLNHKDPTDLKKVEVRLDGAAPSPNATLFGAVAKLSAGLQPIKLVPPALGGLPANISPGTNFPPTDPQEVAAECEQIRIFRDSKGNVSEPHWYAALGLLVACTGGQQVAHQWSSGYAGYTYAETQAKMDQWTSNASVPGCGKLGADGVQGVCQRCPHFNGQFKNPIVIVNKKPVLASFVAAQPAAKGRSCPPAPCDPPKPYLRTQGLSVTRWDDQKNISINVLFEFDLYPISVASGIIGEAKINNGVSTWVWREHQSDRSLKWGMFDLTGEHLVDTKEASKHINGGYGLHIPLTVEVLKYMGAYLRELRRHSGLRVQHSHLGWPGRDEIDRFILNGKVIDSHGGSTPCIMSRETDIVTDGMTTAGTLLGQIVALNFFNRQGMEAQQFFIASSLATPLYMATGHHGVCIHASGDSAAGKTTALKAAAGFWADPAKYIVNGTANGITANAREARARALLNLPTMVDEITHMDGENARAMVMSITQARLRDTLRSDRTAREAKLPGFRSSVLQTTGNSSLHQTVNTGNNQAGTANSARIMEVPFLISSQTHTKDQADAINHDFDTNYGWLGEHFLIRAMPTMGLLFESVRKMVMKINNDLGVPGMERFYVSLAAPVFVALHFAQYHGLVHWDLDRLYDWFVAEQMPRMRGQLNDQSIDIAYDNVLRTFLQTHMQDTLIVEKGIIAPFHGRGEIVARHEGPNVWVSRAALSTYCARRGTAFSTLLDQLKTLGVITDVDARKNLGEGTIYVSPRTRCVLIDPTHPLLDFK